MKLMKALAYVWWNSNEVVEGSVSNWAEAEQLIAEIGATAKLPTMLDVYDSDTRMALALGIGRAVTVVTFQYSIDPPYFISVGSSKSEEITEFQYGGEPTEYYIRNTVPIEDGLAALKEFIERRDKPANLVWETP